MCQADLNTCSPKCSALPLQRITKAGHLAVIVKPGVTVCPQPSWYPPAWQVDIDSGSMLLAGPKQEGGHVGNGYVGAWMKSLVGSQGPVQSGYEHVVGVFAGRNTNETAHSPHDPSSRNYGCVSWCDRAHKADLPSFTTTATIASISGEREPNTASAMDLGRASYRRASATKDRTVECVQTTYCHRAEKHILITEFRCQNSGAAAAAVVLAEPGPHPIAAPTAELSNQSVPSGMAGVHCSKMQVKWGETDVSPRAIVSECHTVCDQRTITVPAGSRETFFACVSARHSSVDGLGAPTEANNWGSDLIPADADPTPLAIASFTAANASAEELFASHTAAMAEVLRPGIEVEGDGDLAKIINSSTMALLTTFRASEHFGGSASGGLCGDAYAGGTGGGWDLETWQLPWLLLFYPQMTHSLLQYRIDRMAAASVIAHTTVGPPTIDGNISWDGLRYPIMAALTGLDNDGVTSGNSGSAAHGYVTFPSEDHMTGDISLAAQQYFAASRNITWLKAEGFALIEGIARFWASKATKNAGGTYSIAQTQSPDEYHTNITDGVFPNTVAKQSLYGAFELATAAGVTPNATYKRVADGLRILYCPAEGGAGCGQDTQRDFHPAFINGKSGELFNTTCVPMPGSLNAQCQVLPDGGKIKQADVILIYYPLQVPMKASTKKNDLDLYSKLTDIDGPAMTWMVHSIAYGDIGEDEKAAQFLKKSYAGLVRSPFKVWHEGFNEAGGAPNFINGAGMFLVNIAAGYGGVRWNLTDGSLGLLRPRPPPNCTRLRLRRVFYRGASLNIEATAQGWSVSLDEPALAGVVLQLRAEGAAPRTLTTAAVVRPAGSSATVVQLKTEDGALATVPAGDLTAWLKAHPLRPHTTLRLAPGEHTLSETLVLGKSATGLTLLGGGSARISGGYTVPAAWDTSAKIWKAKLPAGTWSAGADPPRQLWVGRGGERRTRARHPNLWSAQMTQMSPSPYLFWSAPLEADYGGPHCSPHSCVGECHNQSACDKAAKDNRYGFRYNASTDSELLSKLASLNCSTSVPWPPDPEHPSPQQCAGLEAIVYHGWTVSRHYISFIWPAGHAVHLRNPADRPIGFWSGMDSEGGQRYFLENSEALLDSPGEFFVRGSAARDGGGELLYMPLANESAATLGAVLPTLQELLVVDGASDVALQDVALAFTDWACGGPNKTESCDGQSAEWQRSAAVRVRHAENISFANVSLRHHGSQALWFEAGVRGATFERGEISDLGTGAVRVGSYKNLPHSDLPVDGHGAVSDITVSDSLLTDGGWTFPAGTAVLVQANTSNVVVEHNELSFFSYTAISVGWSWNYSPQPTKNHRVTGNHIHHLGYPRQETGDAMACIYTLGQLDGTVVSENLCHDVRAYRSGGYCLSQDQGSSNVLFRSNVCLRTTASPHNTHYGANLTYTNNVFWGGGCQTKLTDPALIAGAMRTSPQHGLPDKIGFDRNLIGQSGFGDVDGVPAQLFEGNFNQSSDANFSFAFRRNLYWSDVKGVDLATAAVFGGESSRVLGKRNGSWVPARKFTWRQWDDQGGALMPRGTHPFASDSWATTLDLRLKPGVAKKVGFAPIDGVVQRAGIRPHKSDDLPPRQTDTQSKLVNKLTVAAKEASARATAPLLAALNSSDLRYALAQRGLPALAAAAAATLLARLRAEAGAAEIIHSLALGNGTVGDGTSCVACDAWSPGCNKGLSRTPLFDMETLPSLWVLSMLGYADPHRVAGWMDGADAVECGILGAPRFTGSLPPRPSPRPRPPPRPPYWPASLAEALDRPIYAVLDLHKVDVGVPDFGPVAVVMNRSSIAPLTALMPADMGLWAPACRFSNRFHDMEQCAAQRTAQDCGSSGEECAWRGSQCLANRSSDNCCSAQVGPGGAVPPGCASCGDAGGSGCCQGGMALQINCSTWDRAPGIAGHVDHLLLATAQMLNDTGGNTSSNLADMFGRSSKPYASVEPWAPHQNYYVEANILATPRFARGGHDVLFLIGAFPFMFGTPLGQQLQNYSHSHGIPLLWGLGPTQCYEGVNHTGGKCGQCSVGRHTGREDNGPSCLCNQRLLDPIASTGSTNITRSAAPKATAYRFAAAWAQAVADRATGRWNATRAWWAFKAAMPEALRLAPVAAGRCDADESGSTIGVQPGGGCVRALSTSVVHKTDDDPSPSPEWKHRDAWTAANARAPSSGVHLSLGRTIGDVVVSWSTQDETAAPAAGAVRWGSSPGALHSVVRAASLVLSNDEAFAGPPAPPVAWRNITVHHATLSNGNSSGAVFYQVFDPTSPASNGSIFNYTAGRAPHGRPGQVSFAVFGDLAVKEQEGAK